MKLGLICLCIASISAIVRAEEPAKPTAGIELGKVLVTPPDQIGGDASQAFIGKAIQQSLISELARLKLRPIDAAGTAPAAGPTSLDSAMERGRASHAEYVIVGNFQLFEGDLRIAGQILSSGSGGVIGTFKATGAVRDLFSLEDTIAEQVKRALKPPAPVATANTPQQPASAPQIVPNGPLRTPVYTQYEGSNLQRSLDDARLYYQSAQQNDYTQYSNRPYYLPVYGYPYGSSYISPYGPYGGYGIYGGSYYISRGGVSR